MAYDAEGNLLEFAINSNLYRIFGHPPYFKAHQHANGVAGEVFTLNLWTTQCALLAFAIRRNILCKLFAMSYKLNN